MPGMMGSKRNAVATGRDTQGSSGGNEGGSLRDPAKSKGETKGIEPAGAAVQLRKNGAKPVRGCATGAETVRRWDPETVTLA